MNKRGAASERAMEEHEEEQNKEERFAIGPIKALALRPIKMSSARLVRPVEPLSGKHGGRGERGGLKGSEGLCLCWNRIVMCLYVVSTFSSLRSAP